MPTLHLICGLPCAGKTTYATALQADTRSVLFTLDRWLISLFGQYGLEDVGHAEHVRRVLACRDLIWQSASELLLRSTDVILDDGFFLRAHRQRYAQLAGDLGANSTVHFIDVPIDVLRERLALRNARLPTYNFRIDPDTLQGFSGLFERPSALEGIDLVVAGARDTSARPA
jgi:predicted kinase